MYHTMKLLFFLFAGLFFLAPTLVEGSDLGCKLALESHFHNRSSAGKQQLFYMLSATGKWISDLGDKAGCEYNTTYDLHYCVFFFNRTICPACPETTGVCVPKECQFDDIATFFEDRFHLTLLPSYKGKCFDSNNKDTGKLSGLGIFAIVLLVFLTVLSVIGSIIATPEEFWSMNLWYNVHHKELEQPDDLIVNERNSIHAETKDPLMGGPKKEKEELPNWKQVLRCFSLTYNFQRLFSPIPGNFGALNGLRFFSMAWVILGHSFIYTLKAGALNFYYAFPLLSDRWTFQVVFNAVMAVDSFFFLSGFLISYFFILQLRKRGVKGINWFIFYFHRVWRIMPLYMFCLLMYTGLSPSMVSGPLADRYIQELDSRRGYCWYNVLFINNFVDESKQCMEWSWFLANDMQFHVITPIIVVSYFLNKKLGLLVWTALLATSFAVSVYMVDTHDWAVSVGVIGNNGNQYFDVYYQKPWIRIPSYLVGIMAGYIYLYLTDTEAPAPPKKTVRIHPVVLLLLYMFSFFCLASTCFGTYHSQDWSKGLVVFFLSFSKFGWAVGLAILITLLNLGYGGIIRMILCARIWEPMGKLTYGAYLLHVILIEVVNYSSNQYYMWSDISIVYTFLANTTISYGLAAVSYVLVEKPSMNLEAWVLSKFGVRGGGE